jgi:hypothetical protein
VKPSVSLIRATASFDFGKSACRGQESVPSVLEFEARGEIADVRTMLAPLQRRLNALTLSTRALGYAHGAVLAPQLKPATPPNTLQGALASCRLFVEHPIARMTALCALIRRATPE